MGFSSGSDAEESRWWSRFDQPDPYDGSYDFADPQSFNRYSYTRNDPVNYTDPAGLDLMMVCSVSTVTVGRHVEIPGSGGTITFISCFGMQSGPELLPGTGIGGGVDGGGLGGGGSDRATGGACASPTRDVDVDIEITFEIEDLRSTGRPG